MPQAWVSPLPCGRRRWDSTLEQLVSQRCAPTCLFFLIVWDKARLKLELTESKLSRLYSELKIQDKEELTLKRLKAEGGDKVPVTIYSARRSMHKSRCFRFLYIVF